MTYKQLKRAVARLGFEGEIGDEETLRYALRRAMRTVYLDRPVVRTAAISVPPFEGRLYRATYVHSGKGGETFNMRGRAYSFTVSGKGQYLITDGRIRLIREFNTELSDFKDFTHSEEFSITFIGGSAFTVYGLCSFPYVIGNDKSDIPTYRKRSCYKITAYVPDYLCPHGEATDTRGLPIPGAQVLGGELILPEGYSGVVNLSYCRAPEDKEAWAEEEILELAPEVEELLPLLVASYVWLDDDPEKAQYYLSLYKDGIATLRIYMPKEAGTRLVTNGWA
ncbi:MAG: hypothetical protein IKC32_04130 [Clostridia bacterium]|nr:hypothetical protein [Clostridia bacterium]